MIDTTHWVRNLLLLLRIIIISDLAPLIATSDTVMHEVIVWSKVLCRTLQDPTCQCISLSDVTVSSKMVCCVAVMSTAWRINTGNS